MEGERMEFRYTPRPYSRERGLLGDYEADFKIDVRVAHGVVQLCANRDGLVTLAKHLLALAQPDVPSGCHFHFDPGLVLEEGSTGLVIAKVPDSAPQE